MASIICCAPALLVSLPSAAETNKSKMQMEEMILTSSIRKMNSKLELSIRASPSSPAKFASLSIILVSRSRSTSNILVPGRSPDHCATTYANVSCTNEVISGYWMGPDVEDGWGFVDAVINHVSEF